jgi:hypothetical protein
MSTETIKVVAEILKHEMGLKADQVLLYNQKFDTPSDERLYLAVSLLGSKPFGANTGYVADPISGELTEQQSVNVQELYSVLLYSRSASARLRTWEVPAALVSTFAQQQMEAHSFKIGYLPQMTDVSEQEGTSRLNRYSLTFAALVAYRKTKPVDYFDKFTQPLLITNQ